MDLNDPGLSFSIIYSDVHLIEVKVEASNGKYSGVTLFYLGIEGEEILEFVEKMEGFPSQVDQTSKFDFGLPAEMIFGKENLPREVLPASSNVGLRFYCIDNFWHTAVEINLCEFNWISREAAKGKASFEMLFEPAALDTFLLELRILVEEKKGVATLKGRLEEVETPG